MRRILALVCMALVIAGLVIVAGCGDSGFSEVEADESIKEGIKSNFIDQDGNLAAFTQFGTFKLVVDDQLVQGNYEIVSGQDGSSLVLTFENGEVETWSIVVSDGKVTAVIDDEGTEYTQEDYLELKRRSAD